MTTGQLLRVYKDSKAQIIKVGTIGKVNQKLPEKLCLNRYPSMKDSGYEVYYYGGALNAPEKKFKKTMTRNVITEYDCALA